MSCSINRMDTQYEDKQVLQDDALSNNYYEQFTNIDVNIPENKEFNDFTRQHNTHGIVKHIGNSFLQIQPSDFYWPQEAKVYKVEPKQNYGNSNDKLTDFFKPTTEYENDGSYLYNSMSDSSAKKSEFSDCKNSGNTFEMINYGSDNFGSTCEGYNDLSNNCNNSGTSIFDKPQITPNSASSFVEKTSYEDMDLCEIFNIYERGNKTMANNEPSFSDKTENTTEAIHMLTSEIRSIIAESITGVISMDCSDSSYAGVEEKATGEDHVVPNINGFPEEIYNITSQSFSEICDKYETNIKQKDIIKRSQVHDSNLVALKNVKVIAKDSTALIPSSRITAVTPGGQIVTIDCSHGRPKTLKTKYEMAFWNTAEKLNSEKARCVIENGEFLPKSFSSIKEKLFASLVIKESTKLKKWANEPNEFLIHDISFIEKEYWLCKVDRSIKQCISTNPEGVLPWIDKLKQIDIVISNLWRHPEILETTGKISKKLCHESIPKDMIDLFAEKLREIISSSDKGKELIQYLDRSENKDKKSGGTAVNTFEYIFLRGSRPPKKKRQRKTDTTTVSSLMIDSLDRASNDYTLPEPTDKKIWKCFIPHLLLSNRKQGFYAYMRKPPKQQSNISSPLTTLS